MSEPVNTVDFRHIRAEPKSKHDSFESLCVQLFRLTTAGTKGAEFVSLRGAGGDGGVEAFFRCANGDVIGLQAKYFFRLGSSEFSQIKASFKTACENYLTLRNYEIYVPFDLTGDKAAGSRGTSEIARFSRWREDAQAKAAENGQIVTISLVSKAEIRRRLLEIDVHGGSRRYWFSDSVLTAGQIARGLEQAKAFAGPRYSSLLDVETEAHSALDFFGRTVSRGTWLSVEVSRYRSTLRRLSRDESDVFSVLATEDAGAAIKLAAAAGDLLRALGTDELRFRQVDELESAVDSLLPLVEQAERLQFKAFCEEHGAESDTPGFRQFQAEYMVAFPAKDLDRCRETIASLRKLRSKLLGPELRASTARSLLLEGPPGIGKTHALVSAAERRFDAGAFSVVVFGDDFSAGEPWEVLRTKLGFGGSIGRDELFECLSAAAASTGYPFVIYIDALNESPNAARWKGKLPEFLQQVAPYSDILVCVSTRDTYRDLVVDARFPGFAFRHRGFEGKQTQALEAFCEAYGLESEITPLFSEEVSNPLLLHLACKTIKATEGEHLDLSLPGFNSLFESYLSVCDSAIRLRLGYSNPANQVKRCMLALSDAWKVDEGEGILWDTASALLASILGNDASPEKMLEELRREGLLILTHSASQTWLVRFAFQKFGDVLRANSLLESCMSDASVDIERLRASLMGVSPELDAGLLESLAAVLPERAHIEITNAELALDASVSSKALIDSLVWRSRGSVTARTSEAVLQCLSVGGLWQRVYETVFKVSLLPDYVLNADWLHVFFARQTPVQRDVYLSTFLYTSYEDSGAARAIVEASLRGNLARWPHESRRLICLVLLWMTSCADRRVRDHATKGLARVFSGYPALAGQATSLVEGIDDDYVLESFALAVYSAALLAPSRANEFVAVLKEMVTPSFDIANINVRDSVRMLGEHLEELVGLPGEIEPRLRAMETPRQLPSVWPTYREAECLTKLENLPGNMELGGQFGTDFWRYVVLSKLSSLDLVSVGISQENIASWIMCEAVRIGYPGRDEIAIKYDRALGGKFGMGRGRPGYAERLGKKYYWIALHRLVGILARNVPLKDTYYEEPPRPDDFYWSIDLRKVDVTDVRDISDAPIYPNELLGDSRYPFPTEDVMGDNRWIRHSDLTPHEECITRSASGGVDWVCLTFSARDNEREDDDDYRESRYRHIRLDYISVLVDAGRWLGDAYFDETHAFDHQGNHCYRAFFAEYPRSAAFRQCVSHLHVALESDGLMFTEIQLLRGGEWEYDYAADERQSNMSVPAPTLVEHLGLTWDRQSGWLDVEGKLGVVFMEIERRNGLYIRRDLLDRYLRENHKHLVFARFHNRGRLHGASVDEWTYLRYDGDSLVKLYESDSFFGE